MSRVLPTTIVDALDDNVIYPFFAVEMNFDGDDVLRLWTGVGTLTFDGVSWTGTGDRDWETRDRLHYHLMHQLLL